MPCLVVKLSYSIGYSSGTSVLHVLKLGMRKGMVTAATNKIVLSPSWERWSKFDAFG